MQDSSTKRLVDVAPDVLTPLSQTEWKAALARLKDMGRAEPALAGLATGDSPLRSFLLAAFSLSPFVAETAMREAHFLADALERPLGALIAEIVAAARDAWQGETAAAGASEAEVMARLRRGKRRLALILALADLGRLCRARETTAWLSAFADAATAAAIDHLLDAGHRAGKLTLADPDAPAKKSGLIVLAMGKHGARELNYSSDIDLVVFYDAAAGILDDRDEASETFGRMMRRLVRIMQERTGDGYVFRIDLRLRPDPGSTPLAVSVEAGLIYYEGRGQNWERAAFIKARAVAGDIAAGEAFLKELTPFVYRKYLDYAAIADIHSIKRQIHVHKGHGAIAIKGHNVKLGRGGIREIEFFAQTQQLIAGGRMPALRERATEDALKALNAAGWIDDATTRELTVCYWFLRDVEHRLQMVHDEQTQILPQSEAELRRIALMSGFATTASFAQELETVLRTVERRYGRLFEQETKLSGGEGNLVFTGQADDPDTLKTLGALGFERPHDIARVIRTWHNGRYRATQSVEARERLTELMPALLETFGRSRRADEALLRFDSFLAGLPAGIQLFSLLARNPPLTDLMVTIMSAAPRLADTIAARPHVFDGMLDPGLLVELPTRAYLAERLWGFAGGARRYEETLDRLRIFAAEQRFLIGVRLLTGAIDGAAAGHAFTDLAGLVIAAALDAVRAELESVHGLFPGGRVAVIGMGKLGSFELTAGSDVDLILLYDHDEAAGSDGPKPLDAPRYFARLTQRLIAALSAPTAEGVLYAVDMRLRPSGNKGPVATRLRAFERYQREEAWTWEHMALTRARLICGDASLVGEAEQSLDGVLAMRRNEEVLRRDVAEMRALIDEEKPARDRWDLKLIPGGLVDIEFIAQYLALAAPARGFDRPVRALSTLAVLKSLGPQMLAPGETDLCCEALTLFTDLAQVTRLCIDGPFDPRDAPAGLVDLVCRAAAVPDIEIVAADVKRLSAAIRALFGRLMAPGRGAKAAEA